MFDRRESNGRRLIRLASILALCALITAAECDDDDDGMMGPPTADMFAQTDRFGLPAINTVFIPSAMKQTYNTSVPANDEANFTDEAIATLGVFGITGQAAADIADFVFPDVQPIDTSAATAFPNGRAPSDDVIDVELTLIFGAGTPLSSDNVDANDVAFLPTFPYLAAPHP